MELVHTLIPTNGCSISMLSVILSELILQKEYTGMNLPLHCLPVGGACPHPRIDMIPIHVRSNCRFLVVVCGYLVTFIFSIV